MNDDYVKLLKETFQDVSELNPEKVRKLVDATTVLFGDLEAKVASKDPESVKDAEETALAIKEVLEGQMHQLVEMSGMDAEQFKNYAENPANLSDQERDVIAEVKDKLQVRKTSVPKKFKKPKMRLLG